MALQSLFYHVGLAKRSTIVRTAYRGLKGVKVDQFNGLLDAFVRDELPERVYPEMVKIIADHQAMGRRCVIITTGMERLVERALAAHFPPGVELIGCRLLERRGRLTGKVLGPLFGVDKANILHAYCRAIRVDPWHCWAYSDHFSDHHMLDAVGNPVGVNPRGKFRRLCERNGWKVLTPRAAK
jgi:alcohol-forming fatty acyl-CoA reductase